MEHGGTQEKVMITCDDDQVLNLMMEIAVKLSKMNQRCWDGFTHLLSCFVT
jgi:hypothetical protein